MCAKCGGDKITVYVESSDEYKIIGDDGETMTLEFVKICDNPIEYTFVCLGCTEILDTPGREFELT